MPKSSKSLKSSKFLKRNQVRVSFAADSYQRQRADMGAQILFGRSFALQCKKIYQDCVARAPRVEHIPPNRDVLDLTREELFFAKFLARDRDFVYAALAMGEALKPGEFIPSTEIAAGVYGDPNPNDPVLRTEMIGLGRVMKIMGWPRVRKLQNGKLVWGYVRPDRYEIP